MKRYLVTGGTGFLGEHVCRALVERKLAVRSLARTSSPVLRAIGVEEIHGDVTSADDLAFAMRDVAGVFHLAGLVSRDKSDAQRMMRVHVDGTRMTLMAAKQANVRNVVVASSSGTIAVSKEPTVHDESAPYATRIVAGWPYYASKIYQEKLALSLAAELGLALTVVSPSLLLGPGDRRFSSTLDVDRFLKGKIPIVPEGGVNFVDVRDAAAATVTALLQGSVGRFLLGGPNYTVEEFFGRLARVGEIEPPRFKIKDSWARNGAGLLEHLFRGIGKEPPVDRISVEMSQHYWYVDSSKAQRELGFEQREPTLTLVDTVKYLRQGIAA
jgi:dihydroflavonol-4-reductase